MTQLKVSHCPNCGRVFQINIRNLCADCASAMDRKLNAIESYMTRRRHADVGELSSGTGISVKEIQGFIRNGKISASYYANLYDACDRCGGPMKSGTMCITCKIKLQSEIKLMLDSERAMKERLKVAASYKSKG